MATRSKLTDKYEAFQQKLIELRHEAGLTQRGLAKKLGIPRTIIERIEMGERRVDMVEVYWLAQAFELDPAYVFSEILGVLERT